MRLLAPRRRRLDILYSACARVGKTAGAALSTRSVRATRSLWAKARTPEAASRRRNVAG